MALRRRDRLARRNAVRGRSPRIEQLEGRRLLTFVWANRGDASDQFDTVFGATAEVARRVVDSALNEWNRVVVGFDGQDFETQMTIRMNPASTSVSAVASNTVRDDDGVPISGDVTISTGLDASGNTQWYLDPTPDDHSEFMGTLRNPFARDPTPGGPADGMRDLRTILVHELGHTMGISAGSPLIYSNPSITMTNTGITDNSVGTGSNSYWLFQGPSVNAVMTDYDIIAIVSSSAGHTAMPVAGNPAINFDGQSYYTTVDTMQPTSLSIRRVLLSDKVSLMMRDMGYDVVAPETFGTFHSVLNSASGVLTIQGGNDDTLIDNVDQGASSDTIGLLRFGGILFVGVDLGVDAPGAGNGKTPLDQVDMYISRFNIGDVSSIVIQGMGGDDEVELIGDFDFLDSLFVVGGDGDDVIDGGLLTGNQPLIAFGSDGDDVLTGGPGDDVFSGLGGDDVLSGGDGDDQLFGGTGDDTIRGGAGNDEIDGGTDDDFVQGNSGSDVIAGGNGNDFILGGSIVTSFLQNVPDGSDTISGGAGNDVILGDNALGLAPTPLGGSGDVIAGDDGDDLIFGGLGNDDINGGAGDDALLGVWGDDRLIGGLGADQLSGGDGDDELIGGTLLSDVSDASGDALQGGAGNDTLLGDNFGFGPAIGGPDSLLGDEGDDVIYGQYGDDAIAGGSGDDQLFGADGNDRLDGGAGDDDLDGGAGDDLLIGGLGSDALTGGNGDDDLIGGTYLATTLDASGDVLDGGSGDDLLLGDNFGVGVGLGGPDTLQGGSGNDALYGQYGADVLSGGSGNDYLSGGSENDTLAGDTGDDTINGDAGDDHIAGGSGIDVARGGLGDDLIRGGDGADQLYGDGGNDIVLGEAGRDMLSGGAGFDVLIGGSGSDQLSGGAGDDILVGGSTIHDLNDVALSLIRAEWASGRPYIARVANLLGLWNPTLASRANAGYFLRPWIEIVNDGDADVLSGEAGRDWFIVWLGDSTDWQPFEAIS